MTVSVLFAGYGMEQRHNWNGTETQLEWNRDTTGIICTRNRNIKTMRMRSVMNISLPQTSAGFLVLVWRPQGLQLTLKPITEYNNRAITKSLPPYLITRLDQHPLSKKPHPPPPAPKSPAPVPRPPVTPICLLKSGVCCCCCCPNSPPAVLPPRAGV